MDSPCLRSYWNGLALDGYQNSTDPAAQGDLKGGRFHAGRPISSYMAVYQVKVQGGKNHTEADSAQYHQNPPWMHCGGNYSPMANKLAMGQETRPILD